MIEWFPIEVLPPTDGEYLCWVHIRKKKGTYPAHWRYLSLEFAEGVFWLNKGAPTGMIHFWAYLNPPPGHTK